MAPKTEVILVAGTTYPKLKQKSVHPPLYALEHALVPGEWAQLSLQYAKAYAARNADCLFTLFDFYTGVVARFGPDDLKQLRDPGNRTQVVEFEKKFTACSLQPANSNDYRAVRDDNRLVVVNRSTIINGMLKSSRYLAYFDGISELGATTADDYVAAHKPAKGKRTLSAVDVYEFILQGGIAEAGYKGLGPPIVAELHFFSHSYFKGPVFLNTGDYTPFDGKTRYEADRDCRAKKDFNSHNMPRLDEFKKRFAETAFCVVWGCDSISELNGAIKQALVQSKKLTFVNFRLGNKPEMHISDNLFREWFGGTTRISKIMNLFQLANRIEEITAGETYADTFVTLIEKLVFSMPPGAGSDYDENTKQKSTKLMHVAKEDLPISLFFRNVANFKADLGKRIGDIASEFDPEVGRGYIQYAPKPK